MKRVLSYQVNDVEGTDVIWLAGEVVLPISGFPESEALHVGVRVAERGVAVGSAAKVQVAKLLQI